MVTHYSCASAIPTLSLSLSFLSLLPIPLRFVSVSVSFVRSFVRS